MKLLNEEEANKLSQQVKFFVDEIAKLFPAGTHIAVMSCWDIGNDQKQVLYYGTCFEDDAISMAEASKKQRLGKMI